MEKLIIALLITGSAGYGAYQWHQSDLCRRHGIDDAVWCSTVKYAARKTPDVGEDQVASYIYHDYRINGARFHAKPSYLKKAWGFFKSANNVRKEIM